MFRFATVVLIFVAVNLTTIALFAWDKQAAIKGHRRIPERTLLFFALIGATPAAFYAQQRFRHKTQKQPFVTILRLIAVLQIILVIVALAYADTIIQALQRLAV